MWLSLLGLAVFGVSLWLLFFHFLNPWNGWPFQRPSGWSATYPACLAESNALAAVARLHVKLSMIQMCCFIEGQCWVGYSVRAGLLALVSKVARIVMRYSKAPLPLRLLRASGMRSPTTPSQPALLVEINCS